MIILTITVGQCNVVGGYSVVHYSLRRYAENDAKPVFTCADSALLLTDVYTGIGQYHKLLRLTSDYFH